MTSSAKKSTFQAILIMFISNFLSRIIGFVRTIIFGNLVATGVDADAYVFSFLIPDFLNHLLAGSALSIAFIPIFQKLQENKDEEERWRFFSNLFWVGTLLFLICIGISELLTPQLVRRLGGANLDSNQEVFALTVKLTRIIIPAQLFFFWGALFNGVQYANKKFFLPSLTPVAYNVFIIAFGVVLYKYMGVEGFSWGVLVGAFVGNVLIQLFGLHKCGAKLKLFLNLKDRNLKEWFLKTLPLMLGFGAVFSNEFMYRKFGAGSTDGSGAIAALNYGYMIFMVLVGLFGQSIATGVFPFLSKLANENKIKEMEDLLFPVMYKVAALLMTASAVLYFLGEDIISIIFERKNFDADSVAITTKAFLGFLPGAFFLASVLILNRLYYSTKRTITPLVISTLSLAFAVPFYYLLDNVWGVRGISTASSIYAILCFFALLLYWKKLNAESQIVTLLRKLMQILLVSVLIGGVSWGVLQLPLLKITPTPNELQSNDSHTSPKEKAMSSKEKVVSSKENSVSSKEKSVSSKEKSVSSKEKSVSSKENSVSSKEKVVSSKENSVSSKEKSVSSKENSVSSKENSDSVPSNDDKIGEESATVSTVSTAQRYLRVTLVGILVTLLSLFIYSRMQIISISAIYKKIRRRK